MPSQTDLERTWLTNQLGITAAQAASMSEQQLWQALTSSSGALPSYAGQRANLFSKQHNVYNFKPENTRKLRFSLARAMSSGLAEWLVIGDSYAAGSTATPGNYAMQKTWVRAMREELARHGIPFTATGAIRTLANTLWDTRIAYTGATWSGANVTNRFATANGDKLTLTSDVAGDRVTIVYYDPGSGSFSVTVNGVVIQTVTQTAPANQWKKVTVNTPVAVGQTVEITKVSGGYINPLCINVWSSTGGLIVHNISQPSSSAWGTNAKTSWGLVTGNDSDLNKAFVQANVLASQVDPDVLILALGNNDPLIGGFSTDLTIAALTTIRNRYPNAEVLLVLTQMSNQTVIPQATYEANASAIYTLSDTLNCPLLDFRSRLGDYDTMAANGLTVDGVGHLVPAANTDIGRAVGQLLAA